MHKVKRLHEIHELIKLKQNISIEEIAKHFEMSYSTARRDIKVLAEQGKVIETHGSVYLPEIHEFDVALQQRYEISNKEKAFIAKKAVTQIKSNEFVYLDAGTTIFHMIKMLPNEGQTYFTHAIDIASELLKRGYRTHMIGGEMKAITGAAIGEFTMEAIRKIHFDVSFVGSNGVTDNGFNTPDLKEGAIKSAIIQQSKRNYVLADLSKFGKQTSFVFAKRDQATWIHEGEVQ